MKTVRRPPYPKWNPGYFPCSSLTPLPLSSRRPSVSFGGFGIRPSGGGSSPWPDGSPARRVASHCICHSAGLGKPSSIVPWPDCAPCHSLPDGGGGNRPPSGQPNVPANSRQSGLRVPLAASSPRYLALTNIRRRSQSLPAATEDRHRPPSTPNRARTIALPCPYRPFRCCIVIPSVDLGLAVGILALVLGFVTPTGRLSLSRTVLIGRARSESLEITRACS